MTFISVFSDKKKNQSKLCLPIHNYQQHVWRNIYLSVNNGRKGYFYSAS